MKLVVMRNGGQPGKVAINVAKVTHVRSSSGPFTDIYFGDHKVTVDGTLEQVVARLCGDSGPPTAKADLMSVLPIR